MVNSEYPKCCVCFEGYSRSEHVPRVLFCNHTFCSPCLKNMATQLNGMLTVRCPLCRQVSCVHPGIALDEALRVDSHLWDGIVQEKERVEENRKSAAAEAASPKPPQWPRPSSQYTHIRLQCPNFLKKMIFPRQTQERRVPRCNVRMKLC